MSKTFQKICERLCEKWGISICVLCDSFEEHQTHDVHGHFGKLRKQEPCLTKRFTRLRESPSSKYQEIAAYIPVQNAYLNGENLHRETDTIIQKMKSDLQK